jgi:DNA polymerase alpha subunit A
LYGDNKDHAIENIIGELSRIAEMMRNDGNPTSDGIFRQLHSGDPPSDHLLDFVTDTTTTTSSGSSGQLPRPSLLPFVIRPPAADAPLFPKRQSETSVSILRNYGIATSNTRVQPLDRITLEHLVIHMSLSRSLDKYQDRMTPHVAVAQRMVARGEHVAPNMTIAFVIAAAGGKEPGENARIPDEVVGVSGTDVEWYLTNQVMAPIWRLCEPFGGMDVRMIARALGLVVQESNVPAQRDECVAVVIPHTTTLRYSCGKCAAVVEIGEGLRSQLKCAKCHFEHPWKYVANCIVEFVRRWVRERKFVCDGNLCNFVSRQLPVSSLRVAHRLGCRGDLKHDLTCVEMFNTLSYFVSLYAKTMNREDLALEDFRAYVHRQIGRILSCHGFSRIQLSSVFSQSSTGVSDSESGPA